MSVEEDARRGRGFGAAADRYVAGRPGYPSGAVAWVLAGAARPVEDAADIGAGTGKLTAALLAAGIEVVAVDPDEGMLAALRAEVPGARTAIGVAEALPLASGSVDAVLLGQAWHWVDVTAASAEAARVLRPGGVLGLLWNIRDTDVDWVGRLGSIMWGSRAERAIETDDVAVAAPFGALERRTWRWSHPTTPAGVVAMAASRSYVIALGPDARGDVLDRIRDLLASHPDTAGRTDIDLPYTTIAFRVGLPE